MQIRYFIIEVITVRWKKKWFKWKVNRKFVFRMFDVYEMTPISVIQLFVIASAASERGDYRVEGPLLQFSVNFRLK